jgi:hypothetical protein
MKPQKLTILGSLFIFIFCITSCTKKSSDIPPPVPEVIPDSQLVSFFEDQLYVWTQANSLISLMNNCVATSAAASGEQAVPFQLPCDASLRVDSDTLESYVQLSFDGSDCGGPYTRNGYVLMIVDVRAPWNTANTEALLYFDNLEITRKSDGKKITVNGTAAYINLTGGLIHMLSAGNSISHLLDPVGLWVRFDDGEERLYHGRKQITYRVDNGMEITLEGLSEVNGVTNVLAHGSDRNGDNFVISVEAPLVFSETCDYRLTAGRVDYQAVGMDGNVTFGVDEEGNPSPCPGQGNPYYFQADWQRATDPERLQTTIPYGF